VSSFLEDFTRANRAGVEFILTDLNLAIAFLDVAAASPDSYVVRRNHDNARTAYTAVANLLERLYLDRPQRQEIEAKLDTLRARLSPL
jgi:Tfp pilus assembly protein PilE